MNINLLLENIEKLNISLSPEELKNFLKISRRWPLHYYGDKQKTVEIIDNYGEMRINDFFDYKGYLIYEKWQKYYDLGFTSIISHCNDLNENLRNLNDLILNFTGNIPNINIYFSKGLQKNSFDKHKHNYFVIVKQIYGESLWKINDETIFLKNQGVLFLPKETYHEVLDNKIERMSLTISLDT